MAAKMAVNVTVIRPELTEEERKKRMDDIARAAANLYINTQKRKEMLKKQDKAI